MPNVLQRLLMLFTFGVFFFFFFTLCFLGNETEYLGFSLILLWEEFHCKVQAFELTCILCSMRFTCAWELEDFVYILSSVSIEGLVLLLDKSNVFFDVQLT